MAMNLRPTDGLVTRLLQQQTRSHPVATPSSSTKEKVSDKVSISNQAREHHGSNSYGQKQEKLESKLIGLYTKHGLEPKS